MRLEKRDYLFQENHDGDFVAVVDAENHVNHLIETGNFEIVLSKKEKAKLEKEERAKAKENADAVKDKIEQSSLDI